MLTFVKSAPRNKIFWWINGKVLKNLIGESQMFVVWEEKIARMICVTACFFPFGLAVVLSAVNLFVGWEWLWARHDYSFYHLPPLSSHLWGGLLCFTLFVAVVFGLARLIGPKKTSGKAGWTIFCLSLFTRLVVALWAGNYTAPISDFEAAWGGATGTFPLTACNHQLYPAWINFTLVEKWIVQLFGTWYGWALLPGAVCDSVTALMIYLLGKDLFHEDSHIAEVAALLYVCNPASIAYVVTATPEHLCIASFCSAAWLFCWFMKSTGRRALRFVMILGAGVLAGIGNAVKPFLIVFAVALALVCIHEVLSFRKGSFARCLTGFLIVIGVAVLVEEGFIHLRKNHLGYVSSGTPVYHYLCVGLNRLGEGQFTGLLSNMWPREQIKNGKTGKEAFFITWDLIAKDWSAHANEVFPFMMKKMIWAWQDDNIPFWYVQLQFNKKMKNDICGQVINPIQSGAQMYYICLVLLALVGIIKTEKVAGCMVGLLCVYVVLGYFALICIGEAQSRYKCFILPYGCILAASGVALIRDWKRFVR